MCGEGSLIQHVLPVVLIPRAASRALLRKVRHPQGVFCGEFLVSGRGVGQISLESVLNLLKQSEDLGVKDAAQERRWVSGECAFSPASHNSPCSQPADPSQGPVCAGGRRLCMAPGSPPQSSFHTVTLISFSCPSSQDEEPGPSGSGGAGGRRKAGRLQPTRLCMGGRPRDAAGPPRGSL